MNNDRDDDWDILEVEGTAENESRDGGTEGDDELSVMDKQNRELLLNDNVIEVSDVNV